MSKVTRVCRLSLIVCLVPWGVFAQNNSFTTTIQNNATMQANFANQMINLGGTRTSGAFSPANCMPPVDLQRGADGHVPPQLQGDPRYQEYLRCKQGHPSEQTASGNGSAPFPSSTPHLPITATDFVPVRPGHPAIDQAISNMPITPEQRQQLHDRVGALLRYVASTYRGNNLGVSMAVAYITSTATLSGTDISQQQGLEVIYGINDQLAQSPKFALLSAQEKQDESDQLLFESAIILTLRDEAARDPPAQQQAQELARTVLRQFSADDPASRPSPNKVVLGVKVGPVSPAVAAAAGFQGSDGAFVVEVGPGSAAERAGIKAGDILVRLGDRDIRTAIDVTNSMAFVSPGEVIAVRVFRRGVQSDITVPF